MGFIPNRQQAKKVDFPKHWGRVGAVSDLTSCPPAHTASPMQHGLQDVSIAFVPWTWCAETNPSGECSAANLHVDVSDTPEGTGDDSCEVHRDRRHLNWLTMQKWNSLVSLGCGQSSPENKVWWKKNLFKAQFSHNIKKQWRREELF